MSVDKIDIAKVLLTVKQAGEHYDETKKKQDTILRARQRLAALISPDNDLCDSCKKKIHDSAMKDLAEAGLKIV